MSKETQIEEPIVLRCNEDGKLEKYEPYATIDCPTKEDYESLVRAVEEYKKKQSKNVIELPCKIGDTVYVVSQGAGFSCAWNVYQSRVTAIHLDRYNKLFVGTETERENVGGYVEVERVFLTKEEAEEELVRIINKLGGGAE